MKVMFKVLEDFDSILYASPYTCEMIDIEWSVGETTVATILSQTETHYTIEFTDGSYTTLPKESVSIIVKP